MGGDSIYFRESLLMKNGIKTYGELFAIGNAEQPILFTAVNPESGWGNLQTETYYDEFSSPELRLRYFSIMYGFYQGGFAGNVSIRNCFFYRKENFPADPDCSGYLLLSYNPKQEGK